MSNIVKGKNSASGADILDIVIIGRTGDVIKTGPFTFAELPIPSAGLWDISFKYTIRTGSDGAYTGRTTAYTKQVAQNITIYTGTFPAFGDGGSTALVPNNESGIFQYYAKEKSKLYFQFDDTLTTAVFTLEDHGCQIVAKKIAPIGTSTKIRKTTYISTGNSVDANLATSLSSQQFLN
jgi:hypothetical protein